MKSSLVSATSLAALMAFEVAPVTAGPVFDLSTGSAQSSCNNTVSPSACTVNFYALPSQAAATQTVTLTAKVPISDKTIFQAAPVGFSGAENKSSTNLPIGRIFTSNAYGFTGAASAGSSGQTTTTTGANQALAAKGANAAQTSILSFNGITVAPIQSVIAADAGNVLVGQTGTATVTVKNSGHGNLASGGLPSPTTNLKGTIAGASSNGFSGAGSNSISLGDAAETVFTYVYTPTVRNAASGGNSLAVAATFTNGNASGSNAANSATKTIRGTGVAPQDSGISGGNAGFVLVKTTRAVGITVSNANGDGNTSGKGALSNLNGSITGVSGFFSGSPSFSIADKQVSTVDVTFAPTQATGGQFATSSSVTGSFDNGSTDGKNTAHTSSGTPVTGTAVAPIASVTSSNAGFVLVGVSGTATVTVTNAGHGNLDTTVPKSTSNLNGNIGAGGSVFKGSGGTLTGSESGLRDGGSQKATYTFSPTVRTGSPDSTNIVTTLTNGSPDGLNNGSSVTSTLSGQGVAPINQVSSVSPVYARAGGLAVNSTVTIANIGDGNRATGGPSSVSNLNGNIGAVTGTNWTGSGSTFSIQDNSVSSGTTFKSTVYQYAPQSTRGSNSVGAVAIGFDNGNSNQTNTAQTVNVALAGNTVGPVYQSQLNGTPNTPGKSGAAPSSTIEFGTVAGGHKAIASLALVNISTDASGGDHTLTDLSIERFSIEGANATNFDILGEQSGTAGVAGILSAFGGNETVNIGFAAAAIGVYGATLSFFTDEGAGFGGLGNFYTYALSAFVTVAAPEPASMLLLSVSIGGLLVVRRRRQRHGAAS